MQYLPLLMRESPCNLLPKPSLILASIKKNEANPPPPMNKPLKPPLPRQADTKPTPMQTSKDRGPVSDASDASRANNTEAMGKQSKDSPQEDVRVLDGTLHRPTQHKSSRRNFLKLMGAAAVMITAACRRPTERIIPAVIRAPETSPGVSNYYATMAPDGVPLIVKNQRRETVKNRRQP